MKTKPELFCGGVKSALYQQKLKKSKMTLKEKIIQAQSLGIKIMVFPVDHTIGSFSPKENRLPIHINASDQEFEKQLDTWIKERQTWPDITKELNMWDGKYYDGSVW